MNGRTDAIRWTWIGLVLVLSGAAWSWAEEGGSPSPAAASGVGQGSAASQTSPLFDGALSWSDRYFFHQWRIQRHVKTEQCRLLDGNGKRHALGTFEECRAKLEGIKRDQKLAPMHGKAVVLLHGLGAPCWSMSLLGRHLQKHAGYEAFAVDYASTRTSVDDHAWSLANVIQSLEGIEEINLVGHSLGNIVIRRYLAGDTTPPRAWQPDCRIGRIVMIAPPNHGSSTATYLSDNSLFKAVFGKSGRQLGVDWADLERRLATPDVEFGIIAGGFSNQHGFDLFMSGDDDGRISVETTRLAGATDFVVVPALHELIANDARVFELTLRFLTAGYFISAEQRRSIPRDPLAQRAENLESAPPSQRR